MSPDERKAMIRKDHTVLSLSRQCRLLKINRSSIYYKHVGVDAETLRLMNEIDRVFTKYPFLVAVRLRLSYLEVGFMQEDTGCVD